MILKIYAKTVFRKKSKTIQKGIKLIRAELGKQVIPIPVLLKYYRLDPRIFNADFIGTKYDYETNQIISKTITINNSIAVKILDEVYSQKQIKLKSIEIDLNEQNQSQNTEKQD